MRRAKGLDLDGFDDAGPPPLPCEHPACAQPGLYRAPVARDRPGEYHHFCLDHVRAYNQSWDFCAGLDETAIEALVRRASCWDRPTAPLGRWGGRHATRMAQARRAAAGFAFFEDDPPQQRRRSRGEEAGSGRRQGAGAGSARPHGPLSDADRACVILGVPIGAAFAVIRARYKDLVKRLHPDANGGDRSAEDRLKAVNQAYSVLRARHRARPAEAG